jgi:hypothetical protein
MFENVYVRLNRKMKWSEHSEFANAQIAYKSICTKKLDSYKSDTAEEQRIFGYLDNEFFVVLLQQCQINMNLVFHISENGSEIVSICTICAKC